VNAALLLMTSTFMSGVDAHAAAPAAPAVAVGCSSGCGTGCDSGDSCGKKASLLDRIKGRLGAHKCKSTCEPACAPAPAPTCNTGCDSCAPARPNLFDKLKGKFGKKSKCVEAPCGCDGCASFGAASPIPSAPIHPVTPARAPTPPKPMDPKKVGSDGAPTIVIPSPGTLVVPSIPVTPISGGKVSGASSSY
jgi:hypothetical protein